MKTIKLKYTIEVDGVLFGKGARENPNALFNTIGVGLFFDRV